MPRNVAGKPVDPLIQMIWDRGEGDGYAQHMTSVPYASTPPHKVLMEVAFGDYQVSNHAPRWRGEPSVLHAVRH